MRRIVHLDMDAFYASVEQRDDPALRGKPVAVGGRPEQRGVVAAASYEARTFGVRSAMPMARAVRLCPGLVIVHPDFERYRQVSRQVMDLLRACTPLVEPLSLDEAYLDVTENNWNEPLATNVAKRLKREIRETTQLTASAGVAPNKFLAKIASGYRKPDGLTVIAPERVESFLQELPVEALWGVGPVTARKLRSAGIEKLVQIRSADLDKLLRDRRQPGRLAAPAFARRRSAAGGAGPRLQVLQHGKHLRRGPGRARSHPRRARPHGARERGVACAPRPRGAHGDHQGALRGLHDRYAQPYAVARDRRCGRHCLVGQGPRRAHRCRRSARCACSACEFRV